MCFLWTCLVKNKHTVASSQFKLLYSFKAAIMSGLDLLSGLVGSSFIFWIVIGLIAHAKWIQKLLKIESLKITTQNLAIEKHGYISIKPSNRRFYAKRGFVYGYWDSETESSELPIEGQDSPKIFNLASINLIAFTSVFFLIAASKGLFSIIGVD